MADSDLLGDELERVYSLYGDGSRQFRRGLYILIIASLAVFALLVVPFLTFRDQVARLQAREAELVAEIQVARDLVGATQSSLETIRKIRGEVTEFATRYRSWEQFDTLRESARKHREELDALQRSFVRSADEGVRAWALGRADRPPEESVRTSRQLAAVDWRPCYWQRDASYVACQVCEDLSRFDDRVATRLAPLPAVTEETRTAATDDLSAAVLRACAWLNGEVPHWQSGRPLPDDPARLRGDLSMDLRAYEERFGELERAVAGNLPQRELQVDRHERTLATVTKRLGVLEEQLNRFASFDRLGTPIGDLPIGLGQLVLLFPVVVALGFVLVANDYRRMVAVRWAFVRLCRMRDQRGLVIDDRYIAVIAPLWLDAREPLSARLAKWAILLTPLALIVVSLVLIVRTEALTIQLPADAAIPSEAYVVLYAVSVVVVLGSLWQLWARARRGPDQS